MKAVKLLHVVVQPVFVVVDTDTLDVVTGPPVQPATLPASQIVELSGLIEQARAKLADELLRLPAEPTHGDTT